jgi:SAM-dependent methyltransferase
MEPNALTSEATQRCTVCNETSRIMLTRPQGDLYRCGSCDHCFTGIQSMSEQEKYEAEYYEVTHGAWFNNPNLPLYEYILGQIRRVKPDASVMDVGAGRGELLKYLRGKNPALTLTGIDISPVPPAAGIRFIQGDALAMTVAQRYDVVVSLAVIEHVPDLHGFVKVLRELCTPGGVIIVMTLNDRSVTYAVTRLMRRLGMPGPFDRVYDKHHVNHFNVSSLRRLLQDHQLIVRATHPHNVPLAAVDIAPGNPVKRAVFRAGVWGTFMLGALTRKTYLQTVVCTRAES